MVKYMVGMFLFASIIVTSNTSYAQQKECPDAHTLEVVSIENIPEVEKALRVLVPIAYEVGEFPELYSEWEVVTLKPFPRTVGKSEEENYYGMAKYFCGEEVADRSWFVRLHFLKVKADSRNQGQIFIAKKEKSGWFVWFKNH